MQEKFYITTAIPYTNAPPHIGFALELIQADVIARYQRILGKDVFFLTGTDEHGSKAARVAKEHGKSPRELGDENSAKFLKLCEALNISNSDFIRTTDEHKHWPSARKMWNALVSAGDIYKDTYVGKYCVGCEAFLTDKDLENGLCPIHKCLPEELKEEDYFFRLSKYQDELKKLIECDEIRIIPLSRKNEILAFLNRGLKDVSFSRPKEKLAWGIPVPDDDSQVIYVWADALTNYLSGVGFAEAGAQFQRFWPPDVQIVGKDISRFHALIWPAMLLSAGVPLYKTLFVHGFITSGGEKMSKSLGNVVDPFDLILRFGSDAVRYFFTREVPALDDGDYTEKKFIARYNGDLANGIGNLASRIIKLGVLSGREIAFSPNDLKDTIEQTELKYRAHMEQFQFNDALAAVSFLISAGDEYINQNKPWTLSRSIDLEEQKKFDAMISSLAFALGHSAVLLLPFIPWSAQRILDALQIVDIHLETWQGKKVKFVQTPALFPRK